jgi:hypothetical protein
LVDLLGLINLVDFSIISAALGVLVGVVNSIFASRRAETQRQTEIETRQAQLFMDIYGHFRDPEFQMAYQDIMHKWKWEDYDEYVEKYCQVDDVGVKKFFYHRFYSGIAILVAKGSIDTELLNELVGGNVTVVWEKFKPMIERRRIDLNQPLLWKDIEFLYNKFKPLKRFEIYELE